MKNKISIFFLTICLLTTYSCSDTNVTDTQEDNTVYQINKATSNGDTWELKYSLPSRIQKHSVRIVDISCTSNNNVYVATTGGGVFEVNIADSTAKRTNNGLIKFTIQTDTICYATAVLAVNNKIIVASSDLESKFGIFISNDGNEFTSRISWDKYGNIVALYQDVNGAIYAGCYDDLYMSNDNGNTWISLTENAEPGFGYFYTFCFDKYGNIWSGTVRGIYYSNSHTNQFSNIGLVDKTIMGIDINSNEWIFVSTDNGEMYYSNDHGANWEQLINYPNVIAESVYINKNDYIIVGTVDGIYRSKDNGNTWEFIGLKNHYIQKIIADPNGNLIAGGVMGEIYYSPN